MDNFLCASLNLHPVLVQSVPVRVFINVYTTAQSGPVILAFYATRIDPPKGVLVLVDVLTVVPLRHISWKAFRTIPQYLHRSPDKAQKPSAEHIASKRKMAVEVSPTASWEDISSWEGGVCSVEISFPKKPLRDPEDALNAAPGEGSSNKSSTNVGASSTNVGASSTNITSNNGGGRADMSKSVGCVKVSRYPILDDLGMGGRWEFATARVEGLALCDFDACARYVSIF